MTFISPPLAQTIGSCIYCGTTAGPLTDEHVIPYSLYGRLLLLKASCSACQKIIHKFETRVTSAMLGPIRHGRGFSSRPPRRAAQRREPGTEVTIVRDDGSRERHFVAAAHLPKQTFKLPHFQIPPNILDTDQGKRLRPPFDGKNWRTIWESSDPREIEEQKRRYGGVIETKVDEFAFIRFLAKIAHGFSIAMLGQENFVPYLNKFILNDESDDSIFDYVGHGYAWNYPEGLLNEKNPVGATIALPPQGDGRSLLLVHVFLLSNFRTPIYGVVAGECSTSFAKALKDAAGH